MTYSLTAITVFILVEASKMINHLFTRLWVGQRGNSFDSRHRQIFFSLGPPPPTCPLVPQDFSALKGPGREDDHFSIGCLVLKLQMIHGNILHSATHFQAMVLKGAAEVGSYLCMKKKNSIASWCTVHVIKAPTDYRDVIRGPRPVVWPLTWLFFFKCL